MTKQRLDFHFGGEIELELELCHQEGCGSFQTSRPIF